MGVKFWNTIYLKDCRNMEEIPDDTVNLMVTSPPYNVTKQYDDNLTLNEYLSFIENALLEVKRVLVPSGIIALNIANVGRKPYIPLNSLFMEILETIGFSITQEIIWDKGASAGGSCAWGSWKSASNPALRDVHEYIIIAQKRPIGKELVKLSIDGNIIFPSEIDGRKLSISSNELYTNLWTFGTESAKRVNHPAPFRVELPYRIIKTFSKENDLILDPFMGSGSSALAAIITNRRYIGYEISQEYRNIANLRIQKMLLQL